MTSIYVGAFDDLGQLIPDFKDKLELSAISSDNEVENTTII